MVSFIYLQTYLGTFQFIHSPKISVTPRIRGRELRIWYLFYQINESKILIFEGFEE